MGTTNCSLILCLLLDLNLDNRPFLPVALLLIAAFGTSAIVLVFIFLRELGSFSLISGSGGVYSVSSEATENGTETSSLFPSDSCVYAEIWLALDLWLPCVPCVPCEYTDSLDGERERPTRESRDLDRALPL